MDKRLSKEVLKTMLDQFSRTERVAFCAHHGVCATERKDKTVDQLVTELWDQNICGQIAAAQVPEVQKDQKSETPVASIVDSKYSTVDGMNAFKNKWNDGTCDDVRKIAEWVGCKPLFCFGIYGMTWHCECGAHEVDTQCSALDMDKIIILAIRKCKTTQ